MTATDVATAAPTEVAAASETSTSKNNSPVKEKTPEQIQEEANTLIASGKRDLLLNNVPEAVSNLAQACELLSKQFGETANECAEVYFYYGKSLLELSRMESGVLGNALEGVPEEETENNTSQFEDPAKMTEQEKNEVTDNVSEALEENFKDLEEKKEAAKTKDSEKNEDSKESSEAKKVSEEKKEPSDKIKESIEEAKKEIAKEGEEAMEEDEEESEDGESGAEESSDEKKEEGSEEKKDEEEEPSNLQLAWEMLELAKVVHTKQLEAMAGDKTKILKDARIIAETHYQLGVAQGFHAQHDDAVKSLQDANTIIKERMENQKKLDTEEAKKEVKELEALIPEIEEKINDTKDMKKEAEAKKDEGTSASGDAFTGSSKVAEVKPVSSIAVKRKAEEEDTSNKKLAAETETAAAS